MSGILHQEFFFDIPRRNQVKKLDSVTPHTRFYGCAWETGLCVTSTIIHSTGRVNGSAKRNCDDAVPCERLQNFNSKTVIKSKTHLQICLIQSQVIQFTNFPAFIPSGISGRLIHSRQTASFRHPDMRERERESDTLQAQKNSVFDQKTLDINCLNYLKINNNRYFGLFPCWISVTKWSCTLHTYRKLLRILLLFPLGFNGQLSDKCNVTNPHLTHN
jgi:hypothetical protein